MSKLNAKVYAADLPWPVGRLAAVVLLPGAVKAGTTGYVLVLPHRAPEERQVGRFRVPNNDRDPSPEHVEAEAVMWATERAYRAAAKLRTEVDPPAELPALVLAPDEGEEGAEDEVRRFLLREGARAVVAAIAEEAVESYPQDSYGPYCRWLNARLAEVPEPLAVEQVYPPDTDGA